MRLATSTNTTGTIDSNVIDEITIDSIRIELPNGASVCIDLLETSELGVFGSVWIHNENSTIREHVTL